MKPVVRTKLTESIVKAIMKYVEEQGMKVGDRLPSERELSKALGVSRPLLREAIRMMESLKLLEVKPGSGIFIQTPFSSETSFMILHIHQNEESLLEVIRVRKVLEKFAIEEALNNINSEDLKNLTKLLNLLEEAQRRGDSGLEEVWAFYSAIYKLSKNNFLYEFLEGLKELYFDWIDPSKNPVFAEKIYSYHREFFEALSTKNLEKINSVVDRFYRIWEEEIQKIFR
ncbi:MAG TPA: GntR family transcriptional regulator [Dictyoglomaceae bacterium]|mgnify:CR=1 FL=1|nr:GntR family transcriptional regulator [Dictyoglomaceae bacterium]